jgi:hypothetical protein
MRMHVTQLLLLLLLPHRLACLVYAEQVAMRLTRDGFDSLWRLLTRDNAWDWLELTSRRGLGALADVCISRIIEERLPIKWAHLARVQQDAADRLLGRAVRHRSPPCPLCCPRADAYYGHDTFQDSPDSINRSSPDVS